MPDFDIEGSPGNIRSKALMMEQKGQLFYDTGDALSKIDVSGWTGRAADEFREAHDLEPDRWIRSGNGFKKAAAGLTTYAGELEDAQSRAEWARKEYERGEQESQSARTQYDSYMGRMRTYWAGGGTDQADPFVDWGDPIQQEALTELASARADLDNAAATCAGQVRAGCADAPEEPNWLESGLKFVGGIFEGAGEAIWDLLTMVPFSPVNLVMDAYKLATGDLTPEELMKKYELSAENAWAMAEGIYTGLTTDPIGFGKELGKSLLDWDTWADDPARAIGHLVPDAVAAVATAGTGALATRGAKGGMDLLDGLSDLNKLDDLADLRHLDDLGDLGAGARLDDFAADLDGLGGQRAIHAGSADPETLDTLLHSRYREVLGPNSDRFVNGVPDSGLAPEAFQMNCTRCVVATDSSLGGAPASAMPLPAGQQGASVMDVATATGRSWENTGSYGDIAQRVAAEGDGARGIVFGARPDVGHVFNVINDNGTVVFLDGQTGAFAHLEKFDQLMYMPTYP